MVTTFDGDNLEITLSAVVAGVLEVDVGQDIYAEWKLWYKDGNSGFPAAFDTSGGDTVTPSLSAGAYFTLRNDRGWRIKPFENTGTYSFVGNLLAFDLTLPIIIPTDGAFTVLINGLQPITQGLGPIDAKLLLIERVLVGNVTVSLDDETITIFEEDGITVAAVLAVSTDGRIRTRTS